MEISRIWFCNEFVNHDKILDRLQHLWPQHYSDGLVQDCGNGSAYTLELPIFVIDFVMAER